MKEKVWELELSSYQVKEIFYTIQGEGFMTGRPAVFCRFAGCNLWSGREEDRKNAICNFCDTDFVGGEKFCAPTLVQRCNSVWGAKGVSDDKFVVLTGGEPMLQVDDYLIKVFHSFSFEVAIETNGTIEVKEDIDWVCVSPKANAEMKQKSGNEIKLVYPQPLNPKDFEDLEFDHFVMQPKDGPDLESNTQACINYCQMNPKWRLGLQTHKYIGMR